MKNLKLFSFKSIYLIFIVLLSLIIPLILNSCSSDSIINPIVLQSGKGAYILSEGGSSGQLSFYSITKDTFFADIFSGGSLSGYPDGLLFFQNNLFISLQGNFGGPGLIYKTDTNGTVIQASNPIGTNPYSLAISNSKIFLTSGPASSVTIADLNSFNLIANISVGAYPQEILSYNNKIYVCNTSVFSGPQDSTVSVIDAANNNLVATIIVGKDPSALAVSNSGNILVGCPFPKNTIYVINPNTFNKIDSIEIIDGFGKDITADPNSSNIYYITGNNNIGKCDLVTKQQTIIINNPSPASVFFYGYAYNPESQKHFVTDAKNFILNGRLLIYNNSGVLEKEFATGVAPRRIVFKK